MATQLFTRAARVGAATLALVALGACSNAGQLGEILGGVLTPQQGQGQQVSGMIQRVDTRSQQISLQQSNGQTVPLVYDNNTKVVYQNQTYPVTSLEYGDRVTARVQSANNGAYYTDVVQVDQPVDNSSTTSSSGGVYGGTPGGESVQQLQGTVRQVDRTNGWFTLETGNNVRLTVSMPYNAARNDASRFQNLRSGDFVRIAGVFVNNSRVELRQFH